MCRSLKLSFAVFFLLAGLCAAQVTVTTFEGIDASEFPGATLGIDPNGAVGTKQYMEWADVVYQGYNKTTGAPIYPAPLSGNTPWESNNMPDCYGVSGNVQLNFDHLASRWVIGRRQSSNGVYFYCIAVSNTDDLTASNFAWYTYELPLASILGTNSHGHTYFPDYPKIGTWIDAYYTTIDLEDPDNGYAEVGVVVCAFDRTTMLTGGTMRTPQCFRYPNPPTGALFRAHSLEPADIDGVIAPPTGTPEYFASLENPAQGQSTAKTMNEWIFKVNWTTPANSTFTGPISVGVATYTQGCFNSSNVTNTVCVPEPSTAVTHNYIDSVGDRLMQRLTYRNFGAGAYQSWLFSTTSQVGSTPLSQTGIRYYELRNVGTGNTGIITHNDGNYRFMPSVAQDHVGNMAVGYSISGTSMHPGIAASYLNLQKRTAQTEITLWDGTADEENAFTWGVYTSMTVDPVDDCTFWYVNEYFDTNQIGNAVDWQTRISNFKLPTCP